MAGSSVLILTGPPGAGKSTVADILARESPAPSVHLQTDDFFDRYIKSGYILPWLVEAHEQNETVRRAVVTAAFAYAAGGYFTIVDGIVGPQFLDPYRAAARAQNIAVHYVVLRPASADTAFARVQSRATHGLKAEGPVRELHRQFSDVGVLENHALDTTDDVPAQTVARVREALRSDRFRLQD